MKKDELIEKLESLERPDLEMPVRKQHLKQALLNTGHFQPAKGMGFWSAIKEFGGLIFMKSHAWKIAMALVPLFIVVFAFQSFAVSAKPAAYLTLQVNPALQLALDKDNKVVGLKALNNDGKTIIASVDVQNMPVEQALQEITGNIIAGGFVKKDAEIIIALHPAPGADTKALGGIAESARNLVKDRLAKDKLQASVESIVVSDELYSEASKQGILPKSYANLVKANVSRETINTLFGLRNEPGVSQTAFDEGFGSVAESFMHMVEGGISEQAAITALKEALKVDPSLDRIDKVAEALVELKKTGLSEADALNKVKDAIATNPKLDNLGAQLGVSIDGESDGNNNNKDEGNADNVDQSNAGNVDEGSVYNAEIKSGDNNGHNNNVDESSVSDGEHGNNQDTHATSGIKHSGDMSPAQGAIVSKPDTRQKSNQADGNQESDGSNNN
ncbi:MAG TPA: hypothetical protein VGK02_03435 [Candidatus Aquicultor sp.]